MRLSQDVIKAEVKRWIMCFVQAQMTQTVKGSWDEATALFKETTKQLFFHTPVLQADAHLLS